MIAPTASTNLAIDYSTRYYCTSLTPSGAEFLVYGSTNVRCERGISDIPLGQCLLPIKAECVPRQVGARKILWLIQILRAVFLSLRKTREFQPPTVLPVRSER
jgi:hypothetical protein